MEGNKSIVSRALRLTFVIALAAQFLLVGATAAFAPGPKGAGAVYVMSNSADANSILIFRQAVDGSLHPAGEVLTGGVGSGGGLGSQGALTLSQDGHWLVAVNAVASAICIFPLVRTAAMLLNSLLKEFKVTVPPARISKSDPLVNRSIMPP